MKYEILASSSSGNCVIINDVMIDCGISFSKLKKKLYKIRYLLLTHIHTDHINTTALRNIKEQFPRIKVIGNYEVHQTHGVDIISNSGYPVKTKHYEFLPFEGVHDVIVQGFTWKFENNKIIYITDTATLKHAPKDKYDYLFLESNHDKDLIEKIRDKRKGTYSPYLSAKRHLSTQDCRLFYYLNRANKDSKLIELHKSSRFY